MKIVPEKNWEFYSYQTDKGLVVVGFHADADKIPAVNKASSVLTVILR